jgi:hypothetical protein
MKRLLFCLLFSSFCACKHEEFTPDCVCANLDTVKSTVSWNFGVQEGIIRFPTAQFPKSNYLFESQKDFTDYGKRYILCTDSALIQQIKNKGIQDSSKVSLAGIDAFLIGQCNVFYQRTVIFPVNLPAATPLPTIRVKTIDKK